MEIDPIEMVTKLKQIDPNFRLPKSIAERYMDKISSSDTNTLAIVKNGRTNKTRSRRSEQSEAVSPTISNLDDDRINEMEYELKALRAKIQHSPNNVINKRLLGSFGEIILKWNIAVNSGLENCEVIISILILSIVVHFSIDFLLRLFTLKTASF